MSFGSAATHAVNSNIPSIPLLNISSNYNVDKSDGGKILNYSNGTFNVLLPSASVVRMGFYITVWNSSANVDDIITIVPDGLETVDGVSSLALQRGEGVQIVCDNINWLVNTDKNTRLYAENASPSTTRPTAIGSDTIALGSNSSAIQNGKLTYASGQISSVGDAQLGLMVLRGVSTDDNQIILTSDANTANTSNQVILPNDSTYFFRVQLVARRTDTDNESSSYIFEGCVDRNANAASTSFIGSPSKQILAEDTIVWDANIVPDTTNGGISVVVTGQANKTIKWVATVQTVEVSG